MHSLSLFLQARVLSPSPPVAVIPLQRDKADLLELGVPGERLTALFAIEPDAAPTAELAALRARFPPLPADRGALDG